MSGLGFPGSSFRSGINIGGEQRSLGEGLGIAPSGLWSGLGGVIGDSISSLRDLVRQPPAFAQSSYDPFMAGLLSLNQAPQSDFNAGGMTDFNQMAGLLAGPLPQMPQAQPQRPSAPSIMQDPRDFLSGAYFRGGF